MPNRNSILREAAAFAFYLALAVFFTWPLAIRLSTGVADQGDPLLNAWILEWDCWALVHQPLHLFNAPIFVPGHLPLAYSENLLGIALPLFPVWLFGGSAITLHSLGILLGFTLSGYGAYVLARLVTGNTGAAIIAGIFHAFVSFRISHIPHVQIISSGWLPLILAALIVFHRNPSRRNAALFAGALAMNGLTNIYWLMFSTVAVVLTIWLFAIAERRDAVYWRRLIAAIVVAIVVLLPVLAPYAIVSNEYRMKRMGGEAMAGSASWSDWLVPAPNNTFYAPLPDPDLPRAERHLFPGFLLLLLLFCAAVFTVPRPLSPVPLARRRIAWPIDLAIAFVGVVAYFGLVRREAIRPFGFDGSDIPLTLIVVLLIVRVTITGTLRKWITASRFSLYAWAAMLWIVVGFLGSFGRNGFFAEFLFRRTTVFRSLRALCRFAAISYVGLAVWMALGVVALLAYVPRPIWRRALTALLIAAALFDVWPRLIWEYVWQTPSEAQLWLKQNGPSAGGSTLELPVNNFNVAFLYLLGATVHHQPIMNGTSGFEPPIHRKLREKEEKLQYDDDFTDTLERNGCALVLVHSDWAGTFGPQMVPWIERNLRSGRMTFVRRFDHGALGDWLFAVTRNARVHGTASDPLLTHFLRGEATYNHATFGRMDQPRHGEEIHGKLLVAGWALSPAGIKSATALIDAGRVRVPMFLTPREDISRTWPWYPNVPWPAFTCYVPQRPRGTDEITDVQVEVVDGNGAVVRFPDAKIVWK
ncbi:MAG TPA: hypothetical protein VEO74_15725 [Thermoanaerobaculia bacterium]|nr:hypothetical protein [Thermoanaerobaculia bacterium]